MKNPEENRECHGQSRIAITFRPYANHIDMKDDQAKRRWTNAGFKVDKHIIGTDDSELATRAVMLLTGLGNSYSSSRSSSNDGSQPLEKSMESSKSLDKDNADDATDSACSRQGTDVFC